MTNINFTTNDIVVTTRGLYAKVIKIDIPNDKSIIQFKDKLVTVDNSQLIKVNDGVSVICYCNDGVKDFNHRIVIPRQFEIYNENKPFDTALLDYCKSIIDNVHKGTYIITKIKF